MPVYTLPNFNLGMDFWAPGLSPGAGDPNTLHKSCQYYEPTRTIFQYGEPGASLSPLVPIEIRCPIDILGLYAGPYISGIIGLKDSTNTHRYYRVVWWDIVHWQFPNEYFLCHVLQCDNFGNVPDSSR